MLADEADYRLLLATSAIFAGLPDDRAGRPRARRRRNAAPTTPGMITLSRSLIVPFLTFSDRRDLREQAFKAWMTRGENDGEHDNRPIAREILALRNEQARLHGYRHYADYALVDRMAGTPDAVARLLAQVWEPAKARAAAERDALRAMAHGAGRDARDRAVGLALLRRKGAQGALPPGRCRAEALFLARPNARRRVRHRASAVRARRSSSVPTFVAYHPDVRVFEVRGADDRVIGVFLSDNYARPTKRGGAWMSAYRWQSRADGETLPIIVNNNNFAKGPAGEPTLLSADDVRTLFHEFGHGLHGLLSQVTYERLSGTNVLRDFVELPSQLFEHWAFEPAVLKRHALHHATGEPIPDAMIERLNEARRFNQGFETVEYTACALVDMALHAQPDADRRRHHRVRARGARSASGCRARSCCAIGCRTSATCSRAPGTRPAITSTCGPRCSMPTATTRSSRPAIRSIRKSRSASAATCIRRAARCRRPRRTAPSAAAIPSSDRCSPSADWSPSRSPADCDG